MIASDALGVCSWSLRPAGCQDLVEQLAETGLSAVQLAMSPVVDDAATWGGVFKALDAAGVRILSGMISPYGEDYSTLETIRQTGGVVPDATWADNRLMCEQVAETAAKHEITCVTFHAGFVPHDHDDPVFGKVVERVGMIADLMKDRGIDLLLETGQETADDLLAFLHACGRSNFEGGGNLGVNFDPANMILYGKGDPIAALRKLRPFVKQVHLKDAKASKKPGQWGSEVVVGTGQVDWDAFLAVLRETGYDGPMVIEREAGASRIADIKKAAAYIGKKLGGG